MWEKINYIPPGVEQDAKGVTETCFAFTYNGEDVCYAGVMRKSFLGSSYLWIVPNGDTFPISLLRRLREYTSELQRLISEPLVFGETDRKNPDHGKFLVACGFVKVEDTEDRELYMRKI